MILVDVSYDLIISPCGVHCSYVTEIFFVKHLSREPVTMHVGDFMERNESVGSILTGTFTFSAFAYKFAFLLFRVIDYNTDVQELQIQHCLCPKSYREAYGIEFVKFFLVKMLYLSLFSM